MKAKNLAVTTVLSLELLVLGNLTYSQVRTNSRHNEDYKIEMQNKNESLSFKIKDFKNYLESYLDEKLSSYEDFKPKTDTIIINLLDKLNSLNESSIDMLDSSYQIKALNATNLLTQSFDYYRDKWERLLVANKYNFYDEAINLQIKLQLVDITIHKNTKILIESLKGYSSKEP